MRAPTSHPPSGSLLAADAGLMDIEVTGTSLEDAVLDLLKKELA